MEIKNMNAWEMERKKYLRKNIKNIGIISSLIMLVLLFSIMSMQGQLFDNKQQPHAFDFNHELGCSLQ